MAASAARRARPTPLAVDEPTAARPRPLPNYEAYVLEIDTHQALRWYNISTDTGDGGVRASCRTALNASRRLTSSPQTFSQAFRSEQQSARRHDAPVRLPPLPRSVGAPLHSRMGFVTTATVSIPNSLATSATTGALLRYPYHHPNRL
jgi:hypothetical protein